MRTLQGAFSFLNCIESTGFGFYDFTKDGIHWDLGF